MPDITQSDARPDQFDAEAHAFVADAGEPPGGNARLADEEHLAGVAVEAILDDRDVDIHGVAPLQHLVARDAVADDMIDRGADGLRKAPVVEGCRNGLLHIDLLRPLEETRVRSIPIQSAKGRGGKIATQRTAHDMDQRALRDTDTEVEAYPESAAPESAKPVGRNRKEEVER